MVKKDWIVYKDEKKGWIIEVGWWENKAVWENQKEIY